MSDIVVVPASVTRVSGGTLGNYVADETITAGQLLIKSGTRSFTVNGNTGTGTSYRPFRVQTDASQLPSLGLGRPAPDLLLATNNAAAGQILCSVRYSPNITNSRPAVMNFGASTTNNVLYFASPNNPGGICAYADLVTGSPIVVVGIGLGSNRLLFFPIDTGLTR